MTSQEISAHFAARAMDGYLSSDTPDIGTPLGDFLALEHPTLADAKGFLLRAMEVAQSRGVPLNVTL